MLASNRGLHVIIVTNFNDKNYRNILSLVVSPKTGAVVWIDGNGESSHLELHLDQARKLPPVLARVGQVHVPARLGVEAAKSQSSIL